MAFYFLCLLQISCFDKRHNAAFLRQTENVRTKSGEEEMMKALNVSIFSSVFLIHFRVFFLFFAVLFGAHNIWVWKFMFAWLIKIFTFEILFSYGT